MRRSRLVSRALVPVLAGLLTAGVLPAVVASAAPVRAAAPATAAVPQPPQHRGTPDRVAPAGLPADAGQAMPAATRVRELTDRRTANGTFFEMSDGRVQAEISTSPVHYRDAQGRWQDVDTRVVDSDRPGFAKAAVHSGFGSLFGDRSDRLLRVEIGGRHVEFGLPGTPRPVTPAAAGSTVTYASVAGGADVQYAVTASAVKERIVLRERPTGPVSYAFTVHAGGVQARQRADGAVEFARPAGGPVVFTLPRPVMFDGREDPASPLGLASSERVTQTVAQRGAETTITVTPDLAWLQAAERQYPVVVDPTVKIEPTIPDAQDTQILSTAPTTNYGTTWPLSVGTTSTGAYRSLVQFPLTGIPAGTKIDSAQLRMYYDQTHTTFGFDVPIEARRVAAPWTETTATWSTIASSIGGVPSNFEQVDDGDVGKTASTGAWPYSTDAALTPSALNGDFAANKDAVAGDTYTWVPRITEAGAYDVDAHYVPAADRATAAPYAVSFSGGSTVKNVNQASGTGGVWAPLGSFNFAAGTTGKVVLKDSTDPTKATVADAVRFTKPAVDTKKAAISSVWHSFSVRNTVQNWVSGTQPNYGFMLKAVDEATLGRGGPMYEAAEQFYGGETDNRPKLVVTWGRAGVTLDPPTTITGTGAQLNWSAYVDPSAATGDNIVEYQVHRSIFQTFTPGPDTLVAPVPSGTRSYLDTTATPTAADSPQPFGNAFYYMVAVKTQDGELIPAPTQLVRLPKAGRVTKIYQSAVDTTLAAGTSFRDTNLDVYDGDPYVSPGNNSDYGVTRGVVKFPTISGVPTGATIVDARLQMWATSNFGATDGIVDVHPLTRTFDETTATWNRANATTPWTTPGGDYGAALDFDGGIFNDPEWQTWLVDSAVKGWITNPATNFGLLLKMRAESPASQRVMLLASEAAEPALRPKLSVTYLEKTAESTYYAPGTPEELTAGGSYPVDVTLTNTTATTWPAASRALSYKWALPDGTDVTSTTSPVSTPLPQDVSPGESVTVHATLKAPPSSTVGNKREAFVPSWDLKNTSTGQFLSTSDGVPALAQSVAVADPTSDLLGLEKFYAYAGTGTGSGTAALANLYDGNVVWSYDALSNPSQGPATFARLTYNSKDTSTSAAGFGWSLSTSSVMRMGSPLDFHPPGQDWPTEISLTDGDGTTHLFRLNKHGSTDESAWDYDHPAGVHFHLQKTGNADTSRAWSMTRPDRTVFFFDADGYQTAIVDKNGNTLSFTYEQRKSNNKPIKFLSYVTDAAGRQTLTLDYYQKGQTYDFVDSGTGAKVTGATNLTNPKIIDQVESITDVSGRTVKLVYADKGLLSELTDGAGDLKAKVFRFGYDATQGNKNVKLVAVTDPRGHASRLAYYDAPTDPKFKWSLQTLTDRRNNATGFAYTDPDGATGDNIQTTVTDAENHATTTRMDGFRRPVTTTDAKAKTSTLSWDTDHNVTSLQAPDTSVTKWTYDPNTGYPLTVTDAQAVADATPATVLTYATSPDGFVADLATKTSPEGRKWSFAYDNVGNLTGVTDPKGTATATAGDYTTTYSYDAAGQLTTATDANGRPTGYSDYDVTGYPKTITDPLQNATTFVYDVRGNVTSVTDAAGKTSTYGPYDVFGRPGAAKEPKDQAGNVYITTPAPVFDGNDNVTTSTAPNGAVTTAGYDDTDEIVSVTDPKNAAGDPDRVTAYTYDKVGNLTSATAPKGTLTTADPNDFVTRYGYDELDQLTTVTDAASKTTSYSYDDVGNLTLLVDPRKNESADTTDFTAQYTYDKAHRLTSTTDATGHADSTEYDKDGNPVASTDRGGNRTVVTLDERAKPVQVAVPHDTGIANVTAFGYDQVGNRTTVETPRGVATAAAGDFTQTTVYDELNRVSEQIYPFDPADARYNTPDKVTYAYDPVGNLASVSAPPSQGQTVRNVTTYSYWDNGWVKSSADPWDIATSYDYNPLGQQITRTVTSAGGSSARTMSWDYNPDGTLKTRTDDGVPVGKAVALVDNSDTPNVTVTGTWATATAGSDHQGYDYRTHPAGTGTNSVAWRAVVPQDGNYTVSVRFPAVSGAATNATYTVDHVGGSTTKTISQATGAGTWVELGTFAFTRGSTSQKVTLTDQAGGTVVADAVKLVRDNTADTDTEHKSFGYGYDPDGNLVTLTDSSPGAAVDTYAVTYDGLDRVDTVQEKAGPQVKHTTSFGYDANSAPATRVHDGAPATFTWDKRNLLITVTNAESTSDPAPKVTRYNYTGRGQLFQETKANGNIVSHGYWADGPPRTTTEKKPDGTLIASHTLKYNPNGDRISDVASMQNADNHTDYLNSTTTYSYDPRDRIATVTKTPTGGTATVESYIHDANDNVTSQTINGVTTTYAYDRNRLQSSTSAGATAAYNYDPFGRLDTVTTGGQTVEDYSYDGFDRTTEHRKLISGSLASTAYAYDPLDRTAARTENAGTPAAKTTDFAYLGLTDQLLDEHVAGALTKTYQYGADGQRLSQTSIGSDGTKTDGFYSYNAHTDVETVTDAAGDTRSTYAYTAYGTDDATGFTGIDKPDPAQPDKQPDNVYRFNAKRWDPATGTYDMGFRDYNPGLNRFLTRDTYTGALNDLNLGTDPYTGNRYAFAGGNPVTGIELDGHLTGAQCGPDGIRCGMTDIASSDGYTPLPPPPAPADDGPNVVQRSLAGRLWYAGSNAVHHGASAVQAGADWVGHNSSTLTDMAGHGAETLLGGAATLAGGALVVSGAATCAASLPLAATGVGAILTAGACAGGAAEAATGAALAGAGIAAMADGISKFRDDFNRLERTGDTSGGGDRAASEQVTVDEALRGLPKGRQPNVRTVGSDAELQDVYDTLSRGGTPIEYSGYKGSWIERPDGIRVGLRDASKSGGRAIDIRYPNGTILKVHIG